MSSPCRQAPAVRTADRPEARVSVWGGDLRRGSIFLGLVSASVCRKSARSNCSARRRRATLRKRSLFSRRRKSLSPRLTQACFQTLSRRGLLHRQSSQRLLHRRRTRRHPPRLRAERGGPRKERSAFEERGCEGRKRWREISECRVCMCCLGEEQSRRAHCGEGTEVATTTHGPPARVCEAP